VVGVSVEIGCRHLADLNTVDDAASVENFLHVDDVGEATIHTTPAVD